MPDVIDLRLQRRKEQVLTDVNEFLPPAREPPPPDPAAAPHDADLAPSGGENVASALFEWEAPEFTYDPATTRIRVAIGVLLVVGGIAAALFGNFLFAILLAIAGGLILAYAAKPPRTLSLAVTSRGVVVGSRLYEFEELVSFWIFYDPPLFKELTLQSKKTFMPMVRMPLGDLDPLRLREVLLPFLKEQRQEASAIDIVAKRLGF